MPSKYHVHIEQVEPRVPRIAKFSRIEFDGCLGCRECVKRNACLYDAYTSWKFDPDLVVDVNDNACVSCMRCVQECKKGILTRGINPRFRELGDDYWTPDIIQRLWKQAETGKIPVSGAGYRGPFSGPGFDSMWTDMSEIVRPTRDGIHGREYISTLIELGRRLPRLQFDQKGRLLSELPPMVEIHVPVVLDIPTVGLSSASLRRSAARAARDLGTMAVATTEEASGNLAEFAENLIVRLETGGSDLDLAAGAHILQVPDSELAEQVIEKIRRARPDAVICALIPLDENAESRSRALAAGPADVIHLQASSSGRGLGQLGDTFITKLIRKVHLGLVEDGIRDQVTLLVTGGIAEAEHVAKAILCGVDGIGLDRALMVALECRLCGRCAQGQPCDADIGGIDESWGAQRITNIVGSFHSQLIELMGAMGLREVRRLRGEVGRAMMFEDLERDNFAPVFGKRNPSGPNERSGQPRSELREVSDWILPRFSDNAIAVPSRFRNMLALHRVVRTTACVACGKCAEVCEFGVHIKAGPRMLAPASRHCRGAEFCAKRGKFCVDSCPEEALRVGPDPSWETFGDPRWTPELILATWQQAETGQLPREELQLQFGATGGGFDCIDILIPDSPVDPGISPSEVDLSIPLNKRGDGRPEVVIGIPIYGGGMSYGSVSLGTIVGRARAWSGYDSFTCTGEGGFPEELNPYSDHVITQVATGLFGVREETIQRVRMVEFKYAQGAKPGLGGHLLGDKVTPAVAAMREAVVGNALFSPFPFHSVYSVEDHKKHVDWIRVVNDKALVSVKVSTPTDVDMVAVGSYYAGAHVIHIDGSYGGTGAAPDIAKKNIAMPLEYAIPKVHKFLVDEGIRERMTLIASGGVRSAWDVAKAIALGADGVVIGTPEMVALECVRCGVCESGRGCPRGIATTDPELSVAFESDYAAQRISNLLHSWCLQLTWMLHRLGMRSPRELVGRWDLLNHSEYGGAS